MFRLFVGGTVALVLGITFLLVQVLDELAPAGSTDVITVWDHPSSHSASFRALVERAAAAHDMSVLKESRTEGSSGVVRHEYVVNPDAARTFQLSQDDVPGFDPTLVTRFRPFSDLPSNRINGTYLTDAGTGAARDFASALTAEGVTVTVHPLSPMSLLLWATSEAPLVPISGTMLLVIVVGAVAWQGSRRNIRSVTTVFGRPTSASVGRDLGVLSSAIAATGAGGLALSVALLALGGRPDRLDLFLGAGAVVLTGTIAFAAAAALVAAVCTSGSVTRGIDGARPWKRVLTVSLVSNVLVLALSTAAAASASASITLARDDAAERSMWAPSLEDVRLTFESSNSELDAAQPELAAMYDRLDRAGSAVLADHAIAADRSSHDPDAGNVVIVNAQYLVEQTLRSHAGTRLLPADLDPRALTLLVPEGAAVTASDQEAWRAFLRFQRSNSADPSRIPTAIELDLRPMEAQRVFTYATDDLGATSTQSDAVVAVLPSATPSVSENFIISNMTTGEVVFTDPVGLRSDLEQHRLTESVATIEPLRDPVSYRSTVIDRDLHQDLAAMGVLVLGLAASAAVTARAVTMIGHRRATISWTHGMSAVRVTAGLLALPVAALVTAGALLVGREPDRVTAIGCVALDVVIVIAATAIFRTARRTRATSRP
ncbi:hypothetical protein [Curtobacterium aurantiacum]|uniref:hypothetical protein n=1 Tax=Curtobacterium aurantiacum TaxID=3236919 RepID=UPI001BE0ABC1|nr:hypothetical protein [Curtobacterium flaccumfaciens]MBT1675947.1 hypothetical protein [Curtobacterium flaccumfaciens pv. flaccumfaciens]